MRKTTACKRQVSFRTVSWNLAGLAEDSLEPFLACARMTMLWDAMLLQETFRKLEGLETDGCQKFLHQDIFLEDATEVGDVQPSLCRVELARNVSF